MKPGESVFDATRRLLQREVKLDLSVDDLKRRLLTVGSYSFLWGLCHQRRRSLARARTSTHTGARARAFWFAVLSLCSWC